ncbi:hypothetical protein GH733_019601 [Mirounga leonina]|nr:hypothetical protein GH733_019601 [Mirounga leonina]
MFNISFPATAAASAGSCSEVSSFPVVLMTWKKEQEPKSYDTSDQCASILDMSVGMVPGIQSHVQNCHEALQMRDRPGLEMLLEEQQASLLAPCPQQAPALALVGMYLFMFLQPRV